jgi:hypothetical protein
MAPKREKNAFERFLDNLKIGYINGKNPIGRAQSEHGFFTSKNASLNLPKLMIGLPYDHELRIKKDDPAAQLRANNARIGQIERIHNTYIKGRVKLAD